MSCHFLRNDPVLVAPVTILVDHRERSPAIVRELRTLGATIEHTRLSVADYVVGERVGIERKTVADLHRSVEDGRLWTQVASLRVDLRRAFLFVEGRRIDHGRVSRAGIRGALLTVIRLGVVVIRTDDEADSALWLWRIASREGRPPVRPTRSVRRGLHGPVAVLAAVPGISPALAARLLVRFGSVAAVASATRDELEAVAGIGSTRAAMLHATLSR